MQLQMHYFGYNWLYKHPSNSTALNDNYMVESSQPYNTEHTWT